MVQVQVMLDHFYGLGGDPAAQEEGCIVGPDKYRCLT